MPASVAARLAGVRADSSFFYYLDGFTGLYYLHCGAGAITSRDCMFLVSESESVKML